MTEWKHVYIRWFHYNEQSLHINAIKSYMGDIFRNVLKSPKTEMYVGFSCDPSSIYVAVCIDVSAYTFVVLSTNLPVCLTA